MTALAYALGVLLFAVGLLGSVALHEAGHLIPGKLFNVKVTQFMVGFGRTLWSRQRGETEYGVKAIPLGGYCKLVGMVPPNEDAVEAADETLVRSRSTGMFAQLVSDAKTAEYEHVDPHDHGRLFYNKPWWQRVIIMGSGVAINLVLAFLLFAIAFTGIGVFAPTTTIQSVSKCVIAIGSSDQARGCRAGDPVAPALEAGMKPGDRIVSFNGHTMSYWTQVQDQIRANGNHKATIVVVRDGKRLTLHARTVVSAVPSLDGNATITKAGFLGVVPAMSKGREHQSLGFVLNTMATGTKDTLVTIGSLPQKLYHVARAGLGLEKRDVNGPMSIVGAGRISGEVATQHGLSFADRAVQLLSLLAGLNLFLGLINLVPLPPFDGGGIATTLYEAVRRGLARLRGAPDPGGVDSAKLLPVTYVMAALILLMSVLLIWADIVAPISLS